MANWEKLAQDFFESVQGFVARSFAPRDERIRALESKVAELQKSLLAVESKAIRYRSVFSESETYYSGDIVTYGGTLWFVRETTKAVRPGASAAFQLMAKSR